jgi:hypothetical protein
MLLSKLEVATAVLVAVALLGFSGGTLARHVLAAKPAADAVTTLAAEPASQRGSDGPPDLNAKVVASANDGKAITLEIPPQKRGEEARRADIRFTDKTDVSYFGVGVNSAKPTEGYRAEVWLRTGSVDTADKVRFTAVDNSRQGRSFLTGGKVTSVSPDGKRLTLEFPPRRDQGPTQTELKLTDETKFSYAYVAKDAAKPTVGYQADVWLEQGSTDTAAKVHLVDATRQEGALVSGKIVGVSPDGNTVTLETPPRVRGGKSQRVDLKITAATEITFHGVGPDGAKLTVGYGVRAWLQEDSTDTAATIMVLKANERGR